MGKTTVVKTFALPKLVYSFTVLENPAVETLDEIKKGHQHQACKLCYSLQLNSNIKSAIPSQAKWSRIFGHELSWTNIFTLLYQVS